MQYLERLEDECVLQITKKPIKTNPKLERLLSNSLRRSFHYRRPNLSQLLLTLSLS